MSDKDKAGKGQNLIEQSAGADSSAAASDSAAGGTGEAENPQAGSGKTAIDAQRQAASQKATGSTDKPPTRASGSGRAIGWLLVLVVLGGLLAGAGYLLQQALQERDRVAEERNQDLRAQLAESRERLSALNRQQEQLAQAQAKQQQSLLDRVESLEQTLAHQRDRLRALSTTTREDWLLAEAEYLLKLANQRLLIERNTSATQGLMEEADRILRDLDDPDLTPVRQALARDLTQIKLATKVDLEGLYLRLAALAETLPQLPTMPHRQPQEQPAAAPGGADAEESPSGWRGWLTRLKNTFSGLGNFIRVRDHAEQPPAILPPDSAAYLQQNLRLMLERAQLAAMREQAEIYRRSLTQVDDWARLYYPQTQALESFLAQVAELAEVPVQQDLPDISGSLKGLADYVDQLHKLDRLNGTPAAGQPEAQQ